MTTIATTSQRASMARVLELLRAAAAELEQHDDEHEVDSATAAELETLADTIHEAVGALRIEGVAYDSCGSSGVGRVVPFRGAKQEAARVDASGRRVDASGRLDAIGLQLFERVNAAFSEYAILDGNARDQTAQLVRYVGPAAPHDSGTDRRTEAGLLRAIAQCEEAARTEDAGEDSTSPFTLLLNEDDDPQGERIADAIFAVRAIGTVLLGMDPCEGRTETVLGLGGALTVIGDRLEVAHGNVKSGDDDRVRDLLAMARGGAR